MRKVIGIIGCMAFSWLGLIVALFAYVEETPFKQGCMAIGAAVLFAAAILFAGYGNSKKERHGRHD